jgi:N-acetylmuramoyl-L-alanine amidase
MNLSWLPDEIRPLVEKATEPQRVAATLWGEARSEQVQWIIAIANVIRNRVKADLKGDGKPDWWGEGYSAVCLAPHQFSCWSPSGGEKNYKRLLSVMQQFASGQAIVDPSLRECIGIAHLVIGDYLRDNTKGSTHYHVATLTPRPSWVRGKSPALQVGRHVLYNNI